MSSDSYEGEEYFPNDEGISLNESIQSNVSKKTRGRKFIPEQWSRVICLSTDDLSHLRAFELAPDLLMANAMKVDVIRGKKLPDWKPIFWPDHYAKQ